MDRPVSTPTLRATHNDRRRLIRFLAAGGAVVREDLGGVVGVDCSAASRSGRRFHPDAFDRLLASGCVLKGAPRRLVPVDGSAGRTFAFAPPPAPET